MYQSGDLRTFEHWAATAEPASRFAYHEGHSLPAASPAVQLARELFDDGEVTFAQERRPVGGFAYVAIKRAFPSPPREGFQHRAAKAKAKIAEKAALQQAASKLDRPTRKVFIILREAARLRVQCPTDQELADVAGVDLKTSAAILKRLHVVKLIELREGRIEKRVAVIRSTGWRTADGQPGERRASDAR